MPNAKQAVVVQSRDGEAELLVENTYLNTVMNLKAHHLVIKGNSAIPGHLDCESLTIDDGGKVEIGTIVTKKFVMTGGHVRIKNLQADEIIMQDGHLTVDGDITCKSIKATGTIKVTKGELRGETIELNVSRFFPEHKAASHSLVQLVSSSINDVLGHTITIKRKPGWRALRSVHFAQIFTSHPEPKFPFNFKAFDVLHSYTRTQALKGVIVRPTPSLWPLTKH